MPLPSTLGKYQIEREVGRGGFAVVYQAHDPSLGRRVALKVPHAWLLTDPKFVERFHREARLAASLTHPHIVTIYEIGEEQGTPFIAMEWLEGMPLDRWLAEVRPQPQAVLQALLGVGAALDMAHARGVVHRDIKPSNIMMVAGRGGVLTDFGIAKLLAQATASTSGVIGTPNYMAPEVLKGHPATSAADIYGFGVMLYQILTGRLPFEGDTPNAVAYQHANEPPPDPRGINPEVPKQTASLLFQMLAKNPRERPAGAERLLRGLLASLEERGTALAPRRPVPKGKSLWLLTSMAFVLVVVAMFAWILLRRGLPVAPVAVKVGEGAVSTGPSDVVASVVTPTQLASGAFSPHSIETPTIGRPATSTIVPTATSASTDTATAAPTFTQSPSATPTPSSTPAATSTVSVVPGYGRGHIVFSSLRDGNPELYLIDATGSDLRRLTQSPGDDWSPAWSRDGRQIAFTSSRDATVAGVHNIYIMDADGSNVRRLTYNLAWDEYADWSPDGSRLAFVTTADDNAEILVAPAYGGDAQRLTYTYWNERNPAWSPDGSLLAFSSDQTGLWQIYLMNAAGSSPRQLSAMTADSFKPVWSPDGGRIAFHSDQNGNRDIYTINTDGSNLRRLTAEPSKDEHPAWSPDGSAIVFSSNRGGYTDDLYVVWADGSQPTLLFASTADDGAPAWGR